MNTLNWNNALRLTLQRDQAFDILKNVLYFVRLDAVEGNYSHQEALRLVKCAIDLIAKTKTLLLVVFVLLSFWINFVYVTEFVVLLLLRNLHAFVTLLERDRLACVSEFIIDQVALLQEIDNSHLVTLVTTSPLLRNYVLLDAVESMTLSVQLIEQVSISLRSRLYLLDLVRTRQLMNISIDVPLIAHLGKVVVVNIIN